MEMINIKLVGQLWDAIAGTQVLGTAFVENTKLNTQEVAARLPQPEASAEEWQEALLKLNGFFSLVAQTPTHTVISVDRIRSRPLFYGQNEAQQLFISDSAEWVRQQVGDKEMDSLAKDEFQLAGYVTGTDTLYPNVKQLQAGELLQVEHVHDQKPQLQTYRWYRFTHTEPQQWNEVQLYRELDIAVQNSIQRLIDYAAGRQIVIPLSGGYDSRLIALMLKRLGYTNILTFTYGLPGNKESAYSKQVAEELGLQWHFVEYSADKWKQAWDTQERKDYQLQASNWTSLPHIQDWLAVKIIREKGVIEEDAVFAPGHGAMAILSHLAGLPADREGFAAAIEKRKYSDVSMKFIKNKQILKSRIKKLSEDLLQNSVDVVSAFSLFEWQERQSKFLVNSLRVYEFNDYDWWMPLYDKEFLKFWQSTPVEYRRNKSFYINYVRSKAQEQTVEISKLGNSSDGFTSKVRKNIPKKLIPFIKKILSRKNIMPANFGTGRYPAKEEQMLYRQGYSFNGITSHFFLKEFDRHAD